MSPWYDIVKVGDPAFVSINGNKWLGAFLGKSSMIDVYNIAIKPEIGKNFVKVGEDCDVIITSVEKAKSFYMKGIISLHENETVKISIKSSPIELSEHPPELYKFLLAGKLSILDEDFETTLDIAIKDIGVNGSIGIVSHPASRLAKYKGKQIMMFMEIPVEQGIYQSLLKGKIEHISKFKYMKNWSVVYMSFTLSELTTTSVQQIASTYNKPIKVDLTPKKGGFLGRLLGG